MINYLRFLSLSLGLLLAAPPTLLAQTPDSTTQAVPATDEEDYSQYENLGFADGASRRYCTAKIPGLTPQRLVSLGYEFQLPATVRADAFPGRTPDESTGPETLNALVASGPRLSVNLPVISNYKVVWQLGATYNQLIYNTTESISPQNAFTRQLYLNGLKTVGLNTTLFKPLNERHFLLFQGSADLNGDFPIFDPHSLRYLRYSAAAVFGFKPHDRLMWGLGAARTYRVGELNYVPVLLYNWTSVNRRWGVEMLLPARAHVRRNFSTRNILQVGYELEGNTYRLGSPLADLTSLQNPELRLGDAKIRLAFDHGFTDFIWVSAQVGLRHNVRFNLDDGEFFRGFFGDQPYAMENSIGNPLYFSVSLNLVSP